MAVGFAKQNAEQDDAPPAQHAVKRIERRVGRRDNGQSASLRFRCGRSALCKDGLPLCRGNGHEHRRDVVIEVVEREFKFLADAAAVEEGGRGTLLPADDGLTCNTDAHRELLLRKAERLTERRDLFRNVHDGILSQYAKNVKCFPADRVRLRSKKLERPLPPSLPQDKAFLPLRRAG